MKCTRTKRSDQNVWFQLMLYHFAPCALMGCFGYWVGLLPATVAACMWAVIGVVLGLHAEGAAGFERLARVNGTLLAIWALVVLALFLSGSLADGWKKAVGIIALSALVAPGYLTVRLTREPQSSAVD